jgi:pimeloyl-ACP methyl ester carboxylesterase
VLNGVLGDHLAVSGNPLAIPMQLRPRGEARRKLVVLIHGLCMNDEQWTRNGHDHGEALARDLDVTPVYLHYNTGRHISENGRELADQLETLVARWPGPTPELAMLGHSLGGLVARSACQRGAEAGYAWLGQLRQLVCLGSPHHGAPFERGGSRFESLLGLSPYVAPIARLGMLRSAGLTDLRYGSVLDADWQGRNRFERAGDPRRSVPLPAGVACHALAGGSDVLVPVHSALGRHRDPDKTLDFPAAHVYVGPGLNHFDLLDDAAIYARIRDALAPQTV